MRAAFATLVFTALVAANPMPQAVTSAIAPNQSPPPGCSPNYDGTFEVGPVNVSSSSKRDLEKRNTQLGITLKNGILTDPVGRTGYIAANEQFQFDDPPQAGAIWTAGFSVCQNGSLALGSDVIWWKCLSGDFYNLYFKSIGGQCIESYLLTYPINGAGGPAPVSNTPTASTTTSSSSATGSSSSASGNSSTPAASTTATNGTASASSSGSVTVTKGGTTTVVGVGHHHTTATNTKGTTHTQGGQQTTTKAAKTTSAASSSSSSASAASGAAVATLKADIFGLAAGVLAMVVL